MFIFSVRAVCLKFAAAVILSVGVLAAMIIIIPESTQSGAVASVNINYQSVGSCEEIIEFLKTFGWEVDPRPVEVEEVTIPDEFDAVFVNYNEIQKSQGLDLALYKRKNVKRYTFSVSNYPDYEGVVYANVIIYRNRVVGGDICSAEPQGFVHGFEKSPSAN